MRIAHHRTSALTIAGGAMSTAAALVTYTAYQMDIRAARRRVATGAQVADTLLGPIQYADYGRGTPVLTIHGAGGGYNQHFWGPGNWPGDDNTRFIAPSRFGYLCTPVLRDGSPAAQADAHAALLDTLGIGRVAVMGASAGALSAMQFAIRYPERTSALVLVVPDSWAPPDNGATEELMDNTLILHVVLKSDFVMWAVLKLAPGAMMTFLGVPKALQPRLTPEQRARVNQVSDFILPVSQRQAGIINDGTNAASLGRYPLEEIRAPSLILDAADVSTFPKSTYTAEHIPGSTFVPYETGGHLLIGHEDESRAAVAEFLRRHEAGPTGGSHQTVTAARALKAR
jgi:2-hydroxy-6-oxonona-2,4-dienedioate hydrolase